MEVFLLYILKSGICLAVFYVCFKALFSNDTFFRFNRRILLVGTGICMLLPLCRIKTSQPLPFSYTTSQWEMVFHEEEVNLLPAPDKEEVLTGMTGQKETSVPWVGIIGIVYFIGCCICLVTTVLSFRKMYQLSRSGRKLQQGKYTLILLPGSLSPFSWGRYIFLSEDDYRDHPDEILTHEKMHLRHNHSVDLAYMEMILLLQWLNPAVWLLKRELRDIHEYQADKGVLNQGIDATKYQLLLVKKAVGSSLYTLANSFNHSKIKKRITMMLKERTNRWARLKLLFVVPVMGGALYAFAQPEVKEDLGLNTVREVLQSKTGEDQDIFKFVDDEMEAYYNRSPKNAELKYKIRERQAHIVKVDANGQLTLNNKTIAKEDLKEVLKKTMVEHKRLAKEKYNSAEDQVGGVLFSPDTPKEQVKDLLSVMRDAFVEIRADIAQTSGNNSKEYLDKEFPILIGYGDISIKDRKKNPYNNSTTMKITGIQLKLLSAAGKVEKEITNFTLAELERDLKDFCTLQGDKKNEITVSMKVDKGCEMGIVTDVKTVLRNNYLLKLNYQ